MPTFTCFHCNRELPIDTLASSETCIDCAIELHHECMSEQEVQDMEKMWEEATVQYITENPF